MIYQVEIKEIDWIDQDGQEADVCFKLGDSTFWAFCHPCRFEKGATVDLDLTFLESEDISFDTFFSYNTNKEMKILPFDDDRTSYYCYGRILSVNPVVIDCGDIQFDYGEFTSDERVVGEFVYFVITRLNLDMIP